MRLNFLFYFILILCIFSCKKKKEIIASSQAFTQDQLTNQDWIITSRIVKTNTNNPFAEANEEITIEETWNNVDECGTDDIYRFESNGEYYHLAGIDECGGSGSNNTRKWEIRTYGDLRITTYSPIGGFSSAYSLQYFRHGDDFFEVYTISTAIHSGESSTIITRYEHN